MSENWFGVIVIVHVEQVYIIWNSRYRKVAGERSLWYIDICYCFSNSFHDSSGRPFSVNVFFFFFFWLNLAIEILEYCFIWCCRHSQSEALFRIVHISSAYANVLICCSIPELTNLQPKTSWSWFIASSNGSRAKLKRMDDKESPCRKPRCWCTVGEKKNHWHWFEQSY